MKRVICLVASLGFLVNMEAQYSNKKNVADFNAIDVSSAACVVLVQSDSNYVILDSKDSIRKMPAIEVKEGTLVINSRFRGTIEVHVRNLTSIKVSDAARVESKDTLNIAKLDVNVSDAGNADLMVHTSSLYVHAEDASNVKLSGRTAYLEAKASDASNIKASELNATSVKVNSSDGSNISVWATTSIDAHSTDGSNISIKGNPVQKNTDATDGGSVTMDVRGEGTTPDYGSNSMGKMHGDDTVFGNHHHHHHDNGDAFIGGGFVTGGTQLGAPVKYGASREFIIGVGGGHKLTKWNKIGMDVYYKSTDFFLNEDSSKTFPNKVLHQQEKISFQNFGGLVYDRFYFGKKLFLDGGIYGDWAFHSKYITWDNNTTDGSTTKTIQRNLSFVNPLDYGLTFRFGATSGISVYFNYRLSNLFKTTYIDTGGVSVDLAITYPELPAYTIGINIGGF